MFRRNSLVTGGAGFIGSHLVDNLIARGDKVTIIDNFRTGRSQFVNEKANFISHDIQDLKYISKFFEGINDVYHLAANADVRSGWNNPRIDFDYNLNNTLTVAEAAAAAGVENFIFSSTGSVYGEAEIIPTPENYSIPKQTSLYGASKISCEAFLGAYAEADKFRVTILRFVSVLGPRYTHGHVFDFIQKLMINSKRLDVLGDGNQNKSYMHVSDCVKAITELRGSSKFEVFNIGRLETLQVKRSIELICEVMDVSPEIVFGKNTRGWIGDNPVILLDTSKANSLGWNPQVDIEEAIRGTALWIIQNPWVLRND
jgi:UDP-glucose 4-epimerase